MKKRESSALSVDDRRFVPGQFTVLRERKAVEILGAALERAEHELQAHFLEPFSGVQTPGLTRWIRKSHGLSQNLAVSVLMRGHGAVFVREDDQNVWLLQYKPTYECAYK